MRRPAIALASAGSALALVCVAAISVAGGWRDDPPAAPPALSRAGGPVSGEAYLWRPVAIGGGGFITGMSFDAAGKTIVARTDVHGAYLWRSETDSWAQLVTAATMPSDTLGQAGMAVGVLAIAVAPSDGRRIYMATNGTVFRSKDRGLSWQRPATGPFPLEFDANSEFRHHDPLLAVHPDDPDLVWFGSPLNGLWRSADGGRTWHGTAGVPPARDLRPEPGVQSPGIPIWFEPSKGARRVWASSPGQGVFVSSDGGRSFAPLSREGPEPRDLRSGAFGSDGSFFGADFERQALWRFRGGAWTDLTAAGKIGRGRFTSVAVNPRNGEVFAFDVGGRVWRSTDGGGTWWRLQRDSTVGKGDPPWLRVADQAYFATSQVYFDPVTPDRMWTAAGTGVFRAEMPARALRLSWTSQTRGIEQLVTNDVVQAPGRAPLFAAWDFGIHVKPDLNAFSTGYGPRERVLIAAQQLALSPADPDFVATNASDTRTDCCSEDGQAVLAGFSRDAGRSWQRFPALPHPPGTSADDPWRMAFGMIAVSSGDTRNIVWAPSYDRSPFYTRDRGRTWHRVTLPGERLPRTGTHAALHMQRKVLVADPVRSGTFYLAHGGNPSNPGLAGLWRTRDGGETWERRYRGALAPNSQFVAKLRAVPGREGHLFFMPAAFSAGNDNRLRRSTDGGATWAIVPGTGAVDDVAFGKPASGSPYPTIFLSGTLRGSYGIWRSVDAARTWHRVAELPLGRLDRVTVLGADPDVFGRVYIGFQGSGWLHGEPAGCAPAPVQPFASEECFRVK